MKAEQIRGIVAISQSDSPKFLREIAAQLAELNESVRLLVEMFRPEKPVPPKNQGVR